MVALRNHGGSCCGALHIHGFTGDSRPQDFSELLVHSQRDPCRHEVILNQDQCRNNPRLLARLAAMGYVLTTGFVNGNHDSSVFVFHRAGQRLALNDLSFPWAGQIASPSLRGRLGPLPRTAGVGGNIGLKARGATVYMEDIRAGDRFTYHNPHNELHGATLTYVGPHNPYEHDYEIRLTHQATGRNYIRAVSTLRWYSQANPPSNDDNAVFTRQLHVQDDVEVVRTPAPPVPPPAPEPRRVVYSSFHNVYRDGRVGAGYPSLEEATNAAPRAAGRQRQDVYSDGSIENVVNP